MKGLGTGKNGVVRTIIKDKNMLKDLIHNWDVHLAVFMFGVVVGLLLMIWLG